MSFLLDLWVKHFTAQRFADYSFFSEVIWWDYWYGMIRAVLVEVGSKSKLFFLTYCTPVADKQNVNSFIYSYRFNP